MLQGVKEVKELRSQLLNSLTSYYCFLFKSTHAEHVNFLLCQEAPVATTEVLLSQTGKLYTVELGDTIAKALENTTNDTVLATMDLDTYLCLVVVISILYCVCLDLAILKSDTVTNLLQVVSCHVAVEMYVINLLLQELRMGKLAGQVAIVGQKKHTCSVAVKTAYWINTLWTNILHEVHHCLALLRIVACCHIVLWLVEKHVNLLLQADRSIVELHFVGTQNLGSQLGYYLTVDSNHTCLNKLISLTT